VNAPDSIEKAGYLQEQVQKNINTRPLYDVGVEHLYAADREADRHDEAEREARASVPDDAPTDDAVGDGDDAAPAPPGATHVDVKA
jgi:hypothetical protein